MQTGKNEPEANQGIWAAGSWWTRRDLRRAARCRRWCSSAPPGCSAGTGSRSPTQTRCCPPCLQQRRSRPRPGEVGEIKVVWGCVLNFYTGTYKNILQCNGGQSSRRKKTISCLQILTANLSLMMCHLNPICGYCPSPACTYSTEILARVLSSCVICSTSPFISKNRWLVHFVLGTSITSADTQHQRVW